MRTDFAGLQPGSQPGAVPAPARLPPAPLEDVERIPASIVLLGLALVAVFCAVIMRFGMDDAFAAQPQGPELIAVLVRVAVAAWLIFAPFLCWLVAAERSATALALLRAHAAIPVCHYTPTIIQNLAYSELGGDLFAIVAAIILIPVLATEAVILGAASGSVRRRLGRAPRPRFLVSGLITAIVSGFWLGNLAWSAAIPSRIVAAAEAAAAGAPHCLVLGSRLAKRRDELTALRLGGGTTGVLLVIQDEERHRYLNWSFRHGGFHEALATADQIIVLRGQQPCSPVPHFARNLH